MIFQFKLTMTVKGTAEALDETAFTNAVMRDVAKVLKAHSTNCVIEGEVDTEHREESSCQPAN